MRMHVLPGMLAFAFMVTACDGEIAGPAGAGDQLAALLAGASAERSAGDNGGSDARGSGSPGDNGGTGARGPGSPGGNALFTDLAGRLPAFAGIYRTDSCEAVVVVTDMAVADDAVALVKAVIEPRVASSCPDGVSVSAAEGQFTYLELLEYLTAAYALLELDGVGRVWLDFAANAVRISVVSRAAADAVLEALAAAGVPEGAVEIQVRGAGDSAGGSGSR